MSGSQKYWGNDTVAKGLGVAKFDGTQDTNGIYDGHMVEPDGTVDSDRPIQFKFPPYSTGLILANGYAFLQPALDPDDTKWRTSIWAKAWVIGSSGSGTTDFILLEEYDDYLMAKVRILAAPFYTGDLVAIAKPWMLRKSVFDGQTINGYSYSYYEKNERTASHDTLGTQNEMITIPYLLPGPVGFIGEVITAELKSLATGVVDGDGHSIYWEDVNRAGRTWAKIEEPPP